MYLKTYCSNTATTSKKANSDSILAVYFFYFPERFKKITFPMETLKYKNPIFMF